MAHRLAVMAGETNVERLLRRLTAKQFRAWELYFQIEPFGDTRADYHAAQIAQMLYNVNRGARQKPLKLEDFLLKFGQGEQKKQQTWQEQLAIMKALAAAYATEK